MNKNNLTSLAQLALDSDNKMLEKLNKLSGMKYHGGKYTCEEWFEKTGINPWDIPQIRKTSSGLCIWTNEAEKIVSEHINNVKMAKSQLGIAC